MPLLADARAYHAAHTTPGPGSAFMREPMHFDRRNYIQCNIDLRNFADAAITTQYPRSHPAKNLLQEVLSYWTSANSLKQLERFADMRQPTLHRVPTPDGTNFIEMLDLFRLLNMWMNSILNTICRDYGSGTFISLV